MLKDRTIEEVLCQGLLEPRIEIAHTEIDDPEAPFSMVFAASGDAGRLLLYVAQVMQEMFPAGSPLKLDSEEAGEDAIDEALRRILDGE